MIFFSNKLVYYDFLVDNRITWETIFFSRRAKDQIKILKYLLPGKIIDKARNKSEVKSVPATTTIPY
jgi:hypothetical protein